MFSDVLWCIKWHDAFVKEDRMSAKLKGGPGAATRKLREVLVNTAAITMQEDSRLTKHELAQILQIAPSTVHVLLP